MFQDSEEHLDLKAEKAIARHLQRYAQESEFEVTRLKHDQWIIKEEFYQLNIIVTSLLIIFDAALFKKLPENLLPFYEELLRLNAHATRSAKICRDSDEVHMRIVRSLTDYPYSEFVSHLREYKEIFEEIKRDLINQYFR